ncbi:MAG TPA: DUF1778 domain-containing protein [Chloroflexota bacterium]|nr:DUF1778 domain-containing protein [Chloroflexota bacterium]
MGTKRVEGKKERLEARISAEQKELIQRAAELEGRSLTDFIVSTAEAAARNIILGHQFLQLSDRDTERFFAAIENPPEPNPELLAAAHEYREFVGR